VDFPVSAKPGPLSSRFLYLCYIWGVTIQVFADILQSNLLLKQCGLDIWIFKVSLPVTCYEYNEFWKLNMKQVCNISYVLKKL
jgi:hypothetical protein